MRAETYAHKLDDALQATHSLVHGAHLLNISFALMQNELIERGKSSLEWNGLTILELNPFLNSHRPMQCTEHSITVVSVP